MRIVLAHGRVARPGGGEEVLKQIATIAGELGRVELAWRNVLSLRPFLLQQIHFLRPWWRSLGGRLLVE